MDKSMECYCENMMMVPASLMGIDPQTIEPEVLQVIMATETCFICPRCHGFCDKMIKSVGM